MYRYYSLSKISRIMFVVLVIINVFLYNWMTQSYKNEYKQVISDSFSEEYDRLESLFVTSINYSLPIIEVAFASQGYTGKDLTFSSLLNAKVKDPINILKFQLPILAVVDFKKVGTNYIQNNNAQINPSSNKNFLDTNLQSDKNMSQTQEDEKPALKNIDNSKPYILIYHTHTMEAYAATEKNKYIAKHGYDRTDDLNYTVAKVGDYLAEYLKNEGVSVLHDKTIHDYNYDKSYVNSFATVSKILKEHPSIKVAIDLHRDGYGAVMKPGVETIPVLSSLQNQEFRKKYVMDLNGEKIAKVSFIIGSRRTPEMKEDWRKNYEFAKRVSDKLNELYPGLSLGVQVKPYSEYNQHLLEKSILIELGSNYNTLEEAIATTKYLAKAIYEVIKQQQDFEQ
ncbi:stage II sporulation protein P [Thermoanaerobacter thermocopriae]|uniref:stage II sporulation protein P n=1 Tax=Thermoanaerobacter thermocopriae TaxID=29350 RepID=UPI00048ECD86|nr:stage II sporulation protein P [Thermoanaerobacter thermocopriae]